MVDLQLTTIHTGADEFPGAIGSVFYLFIAIADLRATELSAGFPPARFEAEQIKRGSQRRRALITLPVGDIIPSDMPGHQPFPLNRAVMTR